MNGWPYLPLHGGHVAFEQLNTRWPLPHVVGSPNLGVLSASLTAAGSLDRSRLLGLAGPTSLRLNPTALPCSHGTFRWHAGGTNPGSISRCSPKRALNFCLPQSGTRSATSTTIDFGANTPFTLVPAYNLPVYASQGPLPDTTQDSVRGCRLGSTAVAIPGDMVPCAFKAQPAQVGSRTGAPTWPYTPTRPRFQPPPRRDATCGFPALRAPICFMPRLMGPILPGQLSVCRTPRDSCCTASGCHTATTYSTASSRSPAVSERAPDGA